MEEQPDKDESNLTPNNNPILEETREFTVEEVTELKLLTQWMKQPRIKERRKPGSWPGGV